jgi:hypothetical protein
LVAALPVSLRQLQMEERHRDFAGHECLFDLYFGSTTMKFLSGLRDFDGSLLTVSHWGVNRRRGLGLRPGNKCYDDFDPVCGLRAIS